MRWRRCGILFLVSLLLCGCVGQAHGEEAYQPRDIREVTLSVLENAQGAVAVSYHLEYDHRSLELLPSPYINADFGFQVDIGGIPVGYSIKLSFRVREQANDGLQTVSVIVDEALNYDGKAVEAPVFSGAEFWVVMPKPTEEPTPVSRQEGIGAGVEAEGRKVGISMPTESLQRWRLDGESMKKSLIDAGYQVDLQYADNDVMRQQKQVTGMINNGCEVLIIAAVDGSSLGSALDMAVEKGVAVIAYHRMLMDSAGVSYYVTFDNYLVGVKQGAYIRDALDLDDAEGPLFIEVTAGDPDDNNAVYFYQGAIDVLKPYIDEGKLIVKSSQIEFGEVATPGWRSGNAQSRANSVLAAYYDDDSDIAAWLCSNDSTAQGVICALEDNYDGAWPVITGLDCDILSVRNMIDGKQAMSVFQDTRIMVAQTVKMAGQILRGEEVDVNDTATYHNNVKVIPSFLCDCVVVDQSNWKERLIDSGYYALDADGYPSYP